MIAALDPCGCGLPLGRARGCIIAYRLYECETYLLCSPLQKPCHDRRCSKQSFEMNNYCFFEDQGDPCQKRPPPSQNDLAAKFQTPMILCSKCLLPLDTDNEHALPPCNSNIVPRLSVHDHARTTFILRYPKHHRFRPRVLK